MAGSFTAGRFRFSVDFTDWTSDEERCFRSNLEDADFDLRLTRSGRLPDLNGAPIASWVLARLAFLTDDCLCLAGKQEGDGGGYMIEFVVYHLPTRPDPQQLLMFGLEEWGLPIVPDRPVASFQFQGHTEGVAVLGHRVPDCPAEDIVDALEATLLAAPTELTPREISIYDLEWAEDPSTYTPWPNENSRNYYGWDGTEFLGKWNIRDAPLR